MEIISKKDKIANICQRWKNQYYKNEKWLYDDKFKILNELSQADLLTEEKIYEIIGNKSWTENICEECEKDCDILIQLGEEPDYESATVCVCKDCLNKAIDLFHTDEGGKE